MRHAGALAGNSVFNFTERSLHPPTGTTYTDRTAIVKDGSGTLILDADQVEMQQAFVVREGTVQLLAGSVLTNNAQQGASHLTISGKDAVMRLEGATYQQGDAATAVTAVVGGRDGDGTLILSDGSTFSTSDCLYIGVPSKSVQPDNEWSVADPGTYKTGTTELYRDPSNFANQYTYSDNGNSVPQKGDVLGGVTVDDTYLYQTQGTVVVSGGSTLSAQYFRMYNADITISGEGSIVSDTESFEALGSQGHYNIIGENEALDNSLLPLPLPSIRAVN